MRMSGVGLVEMLACLVVAAVVAAVALPGIADIARSSRAATAGNQVLSVLNHARSEAVTRRRSTRICPSSNGRSCAVSLDWSIGLLSHVDHNGNGLQDDGEPVLRVMAASDLRGQRLWGAAGRSNVGFHADGRAAGRNVTLKLCSQEGRLLRRIIINNGGRSRIEPAAGWEYCVSAG